MEGRQRLYGIGFGGIAQGDQSGRFAATRDKNKGLTASFMFLNRCFKQGGIDPAVVQKLLAADQQLPLPDQAPDAPSTLFDIVTRF